MSRRRANRNDADGGYEGTQLPHHRGRRDDHEDPPYDEGDSHGSMADEYAQEDVDQFIDQPPPTE